MHGTLTTSEILRDRRLTGYSKRELNFLLLAIKILSSERKRRGMVRSLSLTGYPEMMRASEDLTSSSHRLAEDICYETILGAGNASWLIECAPNR